MLEALLIVELCRVGSDLKLTIFPNSYQEYVDALFQPSQTWVQTRQFMSQVRIPLGTQARGGFRGLVFTKPHMN